MADKYLILDSRGQPLAHGLADVRPGQEIWTLTVDRRDLDAVLDHEYVQLVGSSSLVAPMEGRILRSRGTRLEVQKLRSIDSEIRQNLRMPVAFATFLYPVSGAWQGRRKILSHDLSCGGIAFFTHKPLEKGEIVEVVIPVTSEPLLVRAHILGRRNSIEGTLLYAAAFDRLTPGEEALLREAVFSLQVGRAD